MARSNKKYIIEFDAETGEFTKGVGEVKKGIDEVNIASEDATGAFDILGDAANNMTGGLVVGFQAGLKAVKRMAQGMVTLKGALISTGVGALVVGLGSLVAWMRNTEAGARTFATATVALDLIWKDFNDTITDAVGEIAVAEDGTKSWGRVIGEWALRLTGAIGLVDQYGGTIDEATEIAAKMVLVQEELLHATAFYTEANAFLNQEIEKQQKVIDDTTKSYDERKTALNRQNKATLDLAENTRLQAALELETLENSEKLLIGDAEKKQMTQEIAQAKADLIDAETRLAVIQLDNEQKSREIDLEEAERKKSIYATVTGLRLEGIENEGERIEAEFEMRKKQLEDELTLLRASDEEKLIALELLDAAKLLALKEYNAAVKEEKDKVAEEDKVREEEKVTAMEDFGRRLLAQGKKEVDDQKKADAAVLSSKLELTKGIGAGIGALGALMKEGSNASKAMALTEIGINTAVGFIQGLDIAQKSSKALGPAAAFAMPIFYASQVAAVLSAAAQAKNILKGGGGGAPSRPSTPSIGGGGGSASEPTPPSIDFGFLETGANQTAIQAYVVEQNVSDSQQANQLIQEQSVL